MNEPRTQAGIYLWHGIAIKGHEQETASRILAIEAEAAALERERLRSDWEDRKRTRASVMHDVGYTMAEVDDLLSEST